jgi:hypothetical protein
LMAAHLNHFFHFCNGNYGNQPASFHLEILQNLGGGKEVTALISFKFFK